MATTINNNVAFQAIRIGIASIVFMICVEGYAADWIITPRVSGGVIYTDNIGLDAVNEEDEFITELGLGVSASRSGGSLSANINYSLQGLVYVEESSENEIFHQLNADGSLELSKNRFYIDAVSSVFQQVIDPSLSGNNNNITTNDNRLSVFTVGIGPRWQQRIGNSLAVQASYRASLTSELESDSSSTGNSVDGTQNSFSASIGNVTNGRSLQWTVQYSQSRDDDDNNTQETRQESVRLNVFYPITSFITLIGVVGDEDNSFSRNANSIDPDDSFWEVGARWQATAQNAIELRVGERFFGETTTFSWDYQGQRFGSSVSYSEDIATTTQNLLNNGTGLTRVIGQVSITERFSADINYSLPRSRISVGVFETRNEFQLGLVGDRTRSATIGWQWNAGPRTQLSTALTAQENEFNNQTSESDTLSFNIQASRQLGPRTTASLGYNYDELESDTAVANEYEANTLTLRVNRTF